jgi:hypothetical protein
MKSKLLAVALLMSLSFTTLWAQSLNFSAAALRQKQSASPVFLILSDYPPSRLVDSLNATVSKPARSVGKALLFSAVIPGTGQFYNKSFLKGLAFVGVEIGSWAVNVIYTQRGNEKTDEFEKFAQAHWNEEKYWNSLSEDARRNGKSIDPSDRQSLKEYERANFSHYLPDTRDQTYYENIGKYDQFNAGWDDSKSGLARERDSENREFYTRIRKTANDQFRLATYGASTVLVNHVLSMLDAAYSTYRFNRKEIKASMGMEMQRYNQELVPALSVRVSW